MRVGIVSTTPSWSKKGNRVTAVRWARLIRQLGHRVTVVEQYGGQEFDLLIALHARRSYPSTKAFRARYPNAPIVLALTGTDLYEDIHREGEAKAALALADRFVTLQPLGIRQLPARYRSRAVAIFQSAECAGSRRVRRRDDAFEVCVVGHLRPVKDPLRAAAAARLLPPQSRIRVLHAGAPLEPGIGKKARAEERANPRYVWLGELSRTRALELMKRARLLVLTSIAEGGGNVVCEAIVCGTPVVSSRIDASVALLGEDYPGYFPVGDERALARLLRRVETDPRLYARLVKRCRRAAPLLTPRHEREAWHELIEGLQRRRRR